MPAVPGASIAARFAVEREIGRGAFATVFRAVDRTSGEVVAVKQLRLGGDAHASAVDRFWREVELLRSVSDPHVVRYVADGVGEGGEPCVVLEWLEGETLGDRQRAKPLPVDEAIEVARQTAVGLAALHDRGIVHRDIKPANLFLCAAPGEKPLVKILDLGIARLEFGATMTVEGLRIGTPSYMSPEQARGDAAITFASDLFSLGAVLYQLLSGQRPFSGSDPFAILAKIVLQEPPRLRGIVRDLHPRLDAIVAQAMAKDPRQRFPSARALAHVLEELPASSGVTWSMPSDDATFHEATSVAPTFTEVRVVTSVFGRFAPDRNAVDSQRFAALAEQHGGMFYPTLGGAVAVFGRTRSTGDEVERAARFGLTLHREIAGARFAIATSRVPLHEEGIPAELIERGTGLLAHANDGVALDAASSRLLARHFRLEARGAASLLVGEGAVELDTAHATGAVFRTMAGRDRELRTLESLLGECIDEPAPRMSLVTGPAGIGKSRLAHEFAESTRRREPNAQLWIARGDALTAGAPYGLVARMLRAGLAPQEADVSLRAALFTRVAGSVPERDRARVTNFLAELLSLAPDQTDVQLLAARRDPMLMGDQFRRAVEDFVTVETQERPLVLVLDDLQWSDGPSLQLIDLLARNLSNAPLFVAGFGRSEVSTQFPALWRERGAQEIRLGELPRKAAEQMVRSALGADAANDRVARLVERASGNPFFLEELVQRERDGGDATMPDTVLALAQSRLDAIAEDDRPVLRAASAIGRECSLDALAALFEHETGRESLERIVAALVQQGVLVQSNQTVGFKHLIVQEAAYASMGEVERRARHARAADWLEARGDVDPALLAEHFVRANRPERAVASLTSGARRALLANDFARVLATVDRAVDAGASGPARGTLESLRAEAFKWTADYVRFDEHLQRAIELLPAGSSEYWRALGERSGALVVRGDHEQLEALARSLREIEIDSEATGACVMALSRFATALYTVGRHALADEMLARAENVAGSMANEDPYVAARLARGHASRALVLGDTTAYRAALEATLDGDLRSGNIRGASVDRSDMGFAWMQMGQPAHAEAHLRQALSDAERMALPIPTALARMYLGIALAWQGRLDEACTIELQGAEGFASRGIGRMEATCRAHLAWIEVARGDLDRAWTAASAAVERAANQQAVRALALASLADVLRARGDLAGAVEASSEGVSLLEKTGGSEESESRIRLAHIEALRALDAEWREPARALRVRIEVRAAKITDPALRTSFLASVPEHARALALAGEAEGRS